MSWLLSYGSPFAGLGAVNADLTARHYQTRPRAASCRYPSWAVGARASTRYSSRGSSAVSDATSCDSAAGRTHHAYLASLHT